MAFGESKSAIASIIVRELTKPGEGAFEPAQAQRLAQAVAEAIEQHTLTMELEIRQKLQVSGLHV
jgi:hypothetical protein